MDIEELPLPISRVEKQVYFLATGIDMGIEPPQSAIEEYIQIMIDAKKKTTMEV